VTGTITPTTGRISEAELAVYLKKQKLQQQKIPTATMIATTNANTVQAQFIPTTQAAITQANKTTVGVTIPTVSARIRFLVWKGDEFHVTRKTSWRII